MTQSRFWQAKLFGHIHDPGEKALILMNTLEGHEGGTVAALRKTLFSPAELALLDPLIRKADSWAAAADRPSLPKADRWAQINFLDDAQLVHPLSGERMRIGDLGDTNLEQLKADSLEHFSHLIQRDKSGEIDFRKTVLAFWRFGPEGGMVPGKWGALWEQLPADTRIPDHTIWSHLDLTSAFAGCFAATDDGDAPVLLSMQFGPVQDFIAQARSTSDLWAGSHLLSRLTWEGIKVLCAELGPDSLLVPQLRGVAMVDAWLYQEEGIERSLFEEAKVQWLYRNDDSNPLFAAALPNKFTALVPQSRASELAGKIEARVRSWVMNTGHEMLVELLRVADEDPEGNLPCYQQLKEQLDGFPEVYWAAVPFDLIKTEAGHASIDQARLKAVQGNFIPEGNSFLDTPVWKLLAKGLTDEGVSFWEPTSGVLFPAIYDLLERLAASVKQARHFGQLQQHGFRCSLTGETEWLTTNRDHLSWTNRQRDENFSKSNNPQQATLWMRLSGKYGIKKGEHLGALAMIKRLWPTFFARWVSLVLDDPSGPSRRYVISTHAISLAPALAQMKHVDPERLGKLLPEALAVKQGVTLPNKLLRDLRSNDYDLKRRLAKNLPALMEEYQSDKETDLFNRQMQDAFGIRPEAYYAIFFMDGDNMGAWLTGGNEGEQDKYNVQYQSTFHPTLQSKVLRDQNGMKLFKGNFADYLKSYRAVSPARHMAVSGALNSFALHLARYIVEDCYMGKLFYAGGDDVMAMVTVKDLLPCIYALRLAYSGVYSAKPTEEGKSLLNLEKLKLGGGHALLNGHLYRTMGHKATASVGAVIAHHSAPLQHVLNEVRKAEKTAKNAGRDAFAIKILKRAGGAVDMNGQWLLEHQSWGNVEQFNAHLATETLDGELQSGQKQVFQLEDSRLGLMMKITHLFGQTSDLSRKLAYVVQDWLPQLPQLTKDSKAAEKDQFVRQLQTLLAYQLGRQHLPKEYDVVEVAKHLLAIAGADFNNEEYTCPYDLTDRLSGVLSVAEFLGRAERHATPVDRKLAQEVAP